jgi:hypothetical protein
MNLRQELSDFITQNGIEETANFFNKKPSTVKTWLKTGNFPIEVVDSYLNHGEAEKKAEENPMQDAVMKMYSALEAKIQNIENFLVQLNQMPQGNNGSLPMPPTRPWYEPDPNDSNVRSMTRPGDSVPTKAQFTATPQPAFRNPTPPPAGLRPGMKPADTWLTPIPRK